MSAVVSDMRPICRLFHALLSGGTGSEDRAFDLIDDYETQIRATFQDVCPHDSTIEDDGVTWCLRCGAEKKP